MTLRTRNKTEIELEKLRNDRSFERSVDAAKQLAAKSANYRILSDLVQAEQIVEDYSLKSAPILPPTQSDASETGGEQAKLDCEAVLQKAVTLLRTVVSASTGAGQTEWQTDARQLLIKAGYLSDRRAVTMDAFNGIDLKQLLEQVPKMLPRSIRLLAEIFAIKGILTVEKLSRDTEQHQYDSVEIVNATRIQALDLIQNAYSLIFLYFQELDKKVINTISSTDADVGVIIDEALLMLPQLIVDVKSENPMEAVSLLRDLMNFADSVPLMPYKLGIGCCLVELLLTRVPPAIYRPPRFPKPQSTGTSFALQSAQSALSPAKYRGTVRKLSSVGLSESMPAIVFREKDKDLNQSTVGATADTKDGGLLFEPSSIEEELYLLLSICELLANREAILNFSQYTEAERKTYKMAAHVYDLMTVFMSRIGHLKMLLPAVEKALRYSFEEPHIWSQFGLSLLASGNFLRGYLVLKEAYRITTDATTAMLIAKTCFAQMSQNQARVDEGLNYAEMAVQKLNIDPESSSPTLRGRAYVLVGIGHCLKAQACPAYNDQHLLHEKAYDAFKTAHLISPDDHLPLYHLALLFACLRQIPDAVQCTASALSICPNHLPTLYLFCLILTAQKSHAEAAQLADRIIAYDFSSARQVSFVKAKLDRLLHGPQRAMLTLKQLLVAWRQHQSELQASLLAAAADTDDADDARSLASESSSQAASHVTVSGSAPAAAVVGGGPANSIVDPGEAGAPSIHGSIAGVSRIESELTSTLFVGATVAGNGAAGVGGAGGVGIAGAGGGPLGSTEIMVTSPGVDTNQRNLPFHVLLALSELYLDANSESDAELCLTEASGMAPFSPYLFYHKGRLLEHCRDYDGAIDQYRNAIAINPYYTTALVQLARLLLKTGCGHAAPQTYLQDALQTDPTDYRAWSTLGRLLYEDGDFEESAECLLTAVRLEQTAPIVPFSSAPLVLLE